jgi:hypothetical protein
MNIHEIFGADRTFTAQINHRGAGTKVIVGDADIAPAVRSLNFDADASGLSRVTLELAVFDATQIESAKTQVVMNDSTRDLLLAAGWLPPEARNQFVELAENFDISGDVPGAGDGVREVLAELADDKVTGGTRG